MCLYDNMRILFIIISLTLFNYATSLSQAGNKSKAVLLDLEFGTSESPYFKLTWRADTASLRYIVYRKSPSEATFKEVAKLISRYDTTYIDTNIAVGIAYDYQVENYRRDYSAYGFIESAIELPLESSSPRVLLIVDDSLSQHLDAHLREFEEVLFHEGWRVVIREAPRAERFDAEKVHQTKEIIAKEYRSIAGLDACLLIGRIAVPYSGYFTIDGHEDHWGAWPADGYYAEFDALWRDDSAYTEQRSAYPRQHNYASDGKFDLDRFTDSVNIMLGRVDLYDLPYFSDDEATLIRKYIEKNIAFRKREFIPEERAIVDGRWDESAEAFSANGWYTFSALLGSDNVTSGRMRELLTTGNYLWAYGAWMGAFTAVHDIAYSEEYGVSPQNAVFMLYLGSYLGDWDSQNNLMRSAIASSPSILTAAWSGRPAWHFHHMGLGKTIGYSTRFTQNMNSDEFFANDIYGHRGVHIALMGDPTLKMRYIEPLEGLKIDSNRISKTYLSWSKHKDTSIIGYNIYLGSNRDSDFTLVNKQLITDTTFVFDSPRIGHNLLLVRAVKLFEVPTGSYYDESPGLDVSFDMSYDLAQLESEGIVISPNPSYQNCEIAIVTRGKSTMEVAVFDATGRQVRQLYDGEISSDTQFIAWDLTNSHSRKVAAGSYYLTVILDGKASTKAMIVIK